MTETKKRKEQTEDGFDLRAAYAALVEGYIEAQLAQPKRKKGGKQDDGSTAL